jgi:hypothetical protein
MVIKIDMRAALLLTILFIPIILLQGQDQSREVVTVCVAEDGLMRVAANCPANEELLQLAGIKTTISGYELITVSTEVDDSDYKLLTAECPEGKVAISGGAGIFFDSNEGYDTLPHLVSSFMYVDKTGWYAEAIQPESATSDWWLEVQAICVAIGVIE